MNRALLYPVSLILIVLVAGFTPVAPWLRAAGGAVLFTLWLYGLLGAAGDSRSVGYLPGHALLFLGLGLVGAKAALWAWLAVPLLTVALDLALRAGRRFLGASIYVILWLDLFASVHQLVALGRGLTGPALWAWSTGVGVFAALFVGLGALRIVRTPTLAKNETKGRAD
ncbi:hypothetical protein J7J35_05320 [Candidatus Bipolaricaulota bacterium]|nr:hypothetical protein [Candidatus Bipolaricaulota bacterium]